MADVLGARLPTAWDFGLQFVWGYTTAFTLPEGVYTHVPKELRAVFGDQQAASIHIQLCTHLTAFGPEKPVFTLGVQGVLSDWLGASCWLTTPVGPIAFLSAWTACAKNKATAPSRGVTPSCWSTGIPQ